MLPIKIQEQPRQTRFMFWWTAPFIVATLVLLPILASPSSASGWIVLGAIELMSVLLLFGLYDAARFHWCWRMLGGIVFVGYVAYLISMLASGPWIGDGRRSSTTIINALLGFVFFGYPGAMYAFLGRFTWKEESLAGDNFLENGIEMNAPQSKSDSD